MAFEGNTSSDAGSESSPSELSDEGESPDGSRFTSRKNSMDKSIKEKAFMTGKILNLPLKRLSIGNVGEAMTG